MHLSRRANAVALITLMCLAAPASGQERPGGTIALATNRQRLRAAILDRDVALHLDGVSLREALTAIAVAGGVNLTFAREEVPNRLVSLVTGHITVGDAFDAVLEGTNLGVFVLPSGRVALGPRLDATVREHTRQGMGVIAGRISDAATGQPLVGASVTIAGMTLGAVSSLDGRYRIAGIAAATHRLTVRRLGYIPTTAPVTVADTGATHADFALTPSAAVLDEVITTVTGNEARSQVGNLIETLHADSIVRTAPVTNLGDVLNARVPGVQVVLNGGMTGESPEINIRGQNSVTVSNQPLVYIDGVRVENSSATETYGTTIMPPTFFQSFSGRLNDIPPEDIASIEIVKGPSAATLYGTDAANGVILITTKRGTAGPARWTLGAETGALTLDRGRFPYSYYAWGHTTDLSHTREQCTLLLRAAGSCVTDSVTRFSPLRDPATTMITTGNRQRYDAQVAGGAQQLRYFVAGTAEQETAPVTLPGPDRAILTRQRGAEGLESDNVHPNTLGKATGRATLSAPIASTADLVLSTGLVSQSTALPSAIAWEYGQLGIGYRDASDGWGYGLRPATAFAMRNREQVTHFTGSAAPTWRPLGWLTARATAGVDLSSNYIDELERQGEGFYPYPFGFRENARVNVTLYSVDAGLTATTPIASRLSFKTSAGIQYHKRLELDNMALATNLAPGSVTLAGGAAPTVGESTLEASVVGAYGEETVGLNDRLFLTGGLRADGGSTFGRNFSAELYPKVSGSWLASDEPWFPRIPGVSTVRLRAAYGSSGVQPGPTDALATVVLSPAAVDGSTTTGARLATLGDARLRPERQTEFEGGVDADLLVRRVHVEATYYHKRSTDALVDVPLVRQLGLTTGSQEINVGSVRNEGVELAGMVSVVDTRAVRWEVSVNGSLNHNALLTLAPGVPNLGSAFTVGRPFGAIFDRPILHYSDANGDGVIEPNEVVVGSTPVYFGSGYPTTQLTGETSIGLLNNRISVRVQADARRGFVLQDQLAGFRSFTSSLREQNVPGSSLRAQATAIAYSQSGTAAGYYDDGSFTRLREVSATYTIPTGVTRTIHVRDASVTLAGRNLAVWTRYTGADPEVNAQPPFSGRLTGYAYYDGGPPPSQYWIARVRVGL